MYGSVELNNFGGKLRVLRFNPATPMLPWGNAFRSHFEFLILICCVRVSDLPLVLYFLSGKILNNTQE